MRRKGLWLIEILVDKNRSDLIIMVRMIGNDSIMTVDFDKKV